jgi:hypothetical protein
MVLYERFRGRPFAGHRDSGASYGGTCSFALEESGLVQPRRVARRRSVQAAGHTRVCERAHKKADHGVTTGLIR